MSVGAGSIKRAARTTGKKEQPSAGIAAEGNEAAVQRVVSDPEIMSDPSIVSEPKAEKTETGKTKAGSRKKAKTDIGKKDFPAEGGKIGERTEKAQREEAAEENASGEESGIYEAYGIGQELPAYLL